MKWILLCFVELYLTAAQHGGERMTGTVGGSITFPVPVLEEGSLGYEGIGVITVSGGNAGSVYNEGFKDRLQWDQQTGQFSIKLLKTNDSGTYKVENLKKQIAVTFQITVYEPVSKPVASPPVNKTCSVVCSVENGREVTLSWYRGEERLNQTSSPDLTILTLPLEMKDHDGDTFSCVAANPVSKETVDVQNVCRAGGHINSTGSEGRTHIIIIIVVIGTLVASGVVGLAVYLKRERNGHSQDPASSEREKDEIYYAEVTHISQLDTQKQRDTELDSGGENPKLTSVYDKLQLHRLGNQDDGATGGFS